MKEHIDEEVGDQVRVQSVVNARDGNSLITRKTIAR
jgi:hypothetical protein